MRRNLSFLLLALMLAGCGAARHPAATTTAPKKPKPARVPAKFLVGAVGPVSVDVQGVSLVRGTLAQASASAPLVLVAAQSTPLAQLAVFARAHPHTHFAYVGGTTAGNRVRNVVGLVLRDDQASELAGVVAGLVAAPNGAQARVAWVGPEERKLVGAFARGLHSAAPHAVLLRQWSRKLPSRCKEAALTAIGRGAVVVMAHADGCADAAVAAAHDQNVPALRLDQFELPEVASEFIVRDALGGVYRGNEDIVFGAASGAIGVRTLDPRIPLATAVRARAAAQQLANGISP